MNTHIGDKIYQNTPSRVAKFRKNRPGTSKNLWWEKQIGPKTRPKYNSLRYRYRYRDRGRL